MITTGNGSGLATALGRPGACGEQQAVLAAAERLLAGTAEAITPDTPARDLLACLTHYRAHLSALAAATDVTRLDIVHGNADEPQVRAAS